MTGKILGAVLIITGCGAFGYAQSVSYRKEEQLLRQFIAALDYMQCELQYRMTPLPELCRQTAAEGKGLISRFFGNLAEEMERQVQPCVSDCVVVAISGIGPIPNRLLESFHRFGNSLGRFDVAGQIKDLEFVRTNCRDEVNRMSENRDTRLRGYQTLGLCAGAALAIIFV